MSTDLGPRAEATNAGIDFDAERTLASAAAREALVALSAELRAAGYANEPLDGVAASRFALGHAVPLSAIDPVAIDALDASGAIDLVDDGVAPRFMLYADNGAIVVVPRDAGDHAARVYFGQDSLWLAELARHADVPPGRHADLGTGAGGVLALLRDRFERAIGTDIVPRTAATAALTASLNLRDDGRPLARIVVTDVADGLCPGTCALVTANPPWVPSLRFARAFSDGGPTGFELPRRFVMAGAELLAPGGVAITLVLDTAWDDGRRPVDSLARGLRRLGYETAFEPTPGWPDLEPDLLANVPGLRSARHAALLVRRPHR